MPGDFAFDLKALRARDEINDALGVMQNQRMDMPGMNYQPQQGPTPSMNVQANQRMQQMGANMPLGGGFSAEMNAMRVPGMGQGPQITNVGVNYQKPGGLSAGLSYNPAARGVNANLRMPFRNGGLAMGGGYMGQPFNPELSQKLLGRAAQVEALNRRYKSRYGLQDSDIDAMFQGTYGLNMADPADSPEFEAARLVSSPYRNELANIYGDLPTMRYALSSPVNALGRTRDSLNQLDVARDRAQQSLVDSSAPEWEQQYLAYMTGATEQMPPAPIGNTPEEWTRRMEIVRTYGPDTAQATVKNWGDTRSAYPDRVAAERAGANEVREGSMGAYNTALADINRGAGMARGGLAAKKMAKGGAWTRKEGQNPEGGLNAAGRASLKAQGHDIKPPVSAKQAKKSPKAAARRKSFCARMSGMPGAMKDENGKPTRKALALRKWDCKAEGGMVEGYAEGGQSRVNEAGNYTKPGMRKRLFESIKSGGSGGAPGQWSARKAQMLAKRYKEQGGGYK